MDSFLSYLDSVRDVNPALIEAIKAGYAITNRSGAFSNSVRNAIIAMKELVPDHYHNTLISRCSNGIGSTTDYTTLNEIENALMNARWKPYSHEFIPKGCWGAVTKDISGHFGMVRLDSLNPRMPVAMEKDSNGYLFPCVKVKRKSAIDYTVMVLGKYDGRNMMYTFHPGDPLEVMKFKNGEDDVWSGDIISAKRAIELGFTYARAV